MVKPEVKLASRITQLVNKPHHGGLVTIICIDCGAERQIHKQDVWQVKRCKPCQKEYSVLKRKGK